MTPRSKYPPYIRSGLWCFSYWHGTIGRIAGAIDKYYSPFLKDSYSSVIRRTLDRAFKERFEVTPNQYMVASRMVGVRRALLAASMEETITDVADDWGFWHHGRFSADYKRMFGEIPSHTLKFNRI